MNELSGTLLEISKGEYQGNPYASIKLRSDDIADGQILKYKVDIKQVDVNSLQAFRDKKVKCAVGIVKGANDSATLKVVKVTA